MFYCRPYIEVLILITCVQFAMLSGSARANEASGIEVGEGLTPALQDQPGWLVPRDGQRRAAARQEADALFKELQALKQEVIVLNKDLRSLEEALLFPANTRLSVFVSMDIGAFFKLESIKLKLDGETVAAHLYSDKEVQALYQGGMQKLYIGNISPGEHELTAIFTGEGPQGKEYKRGASLRIRKANGPKYVELAVTDSQTRLQPEFFIREW